MKMSNNGYKKVESKIFKFDKESDMIEGKLLSREDGKNFDNQVYKIQSKEEVFTVFGTRVLDSLMQEVEIGKQVKIVYTGVKESKEKGKNDTKLFDVFVK